MSDLTIKNLGPIKEADISFGDLTVLIGPQATGKSFLLQYFRLSNDCGYIKKYLNDYGFGWSSSKEFASLFFGDGMQHAFEGEYQIYERGKLVDFEEKIAKSRDSFFTHLYIPAQRVMMMDQGWARPFTNFDHSYPFVLKEFSETIRLELDRYAKKNDILFPQSNRLREELRNVIRQNIFRQGEIKTKTIANRKQLILSIGENEFSVGSWSAGQKEFTPLMLGLYWALPASKNPRRDKVRYITIEEPEMGLHPSAIVDVMILMFELLARGYKVSISTHSATIVELLWGISEIQKNKRAKDREGKFLKLLNISSKREQLLNFAAQMLKKKYKTYFFEYTNEGSIVKDISPLDVNDAQQRLWGGIAEVGEKVADIVGSLYAN